MKLKIGAFLFALVPTLAFAQGYLENPQPYATESGIGVVSGWHCTATDITVTIDGTSLGKSGSGTYRGDTAGVCGHTDTGFSLLYNYNRLAPGPHTIRVYADGILLEERPFNSVKSGGTDFLTGATKSVDVPDFPSAGSTARLTWSQAKQSFVVTNVVTNLSLAAPGFGECYDASIQTPSPFLGNGGEIIVLSDGTKWQDTSYQYLYLYEYYPAVTVCPSEGKMFLGKVFRIIPFY